jgi:Carboxypeptidase regulatory-like domain/TonB dependent receptor
LISSIRTHSSSIFRLLFLVAVAALCTLQLPAQTTLGGITGEVADTTGGVIPNATVTIVQEETGLTRTVKSNGTTGEYLFVNLPIGTYTLTFSADGYQLQKTQHIPVQADRTATINASLKVGANTTTVEVEASPLMNAVDITNGYVLDSSQIDSVPLPTGSFTGLAILSPGVNSELPSGTGANDGLGNQPIWANGQRDTSNSFSLNGVDASNLFNGKSTSAVGSARVVNSTGVQTPVGLQTIPSAASIYLSIGNAIPTPAPETLAEVRVNASMYDASQGSTSGAHIDLSTASGTNSLHGAAYFNRGTDWLNAAPFFYKQNVVVPDNQKVPQLHRYTVGGKIGFPIIKDKLFAFAAYEHLHVSDNFLGNSFFDVPVGLNDTNRSGSNLAQLTDSDFGTSLYESDTPLDHTAQALLNTPSLPGEPGKWLIPNDSLNGNTNFSVKQLQNAFIPGTARFTGDIGVADLDYNASSKDTLAAKYFYQHDPTDSPYSYSSVPGFDQHLDSGAQVFSLTNTLLIKPNLSTTQTLGFIREKNWADNQQPFGPSSIPGGTVGDASINMFGSNYFPGVSIVNVLGDYQPAGVSPVILNYGPNAESQSSNTGVFQNRVAPSGNAIWTIGKHNLSFGANYSYTQLNTIDKRPGTGTVASDDFSQFVQGFVTPGSSSSAFYVTSFMQGDASRYYRSNQLGTYVQDKIQITPTLSITAGVRYDWDGGFTEKYGRLFNFDANSNPDSCSTKDPNEYCYSPGADQILSPGFIIAGNNANGTKGVSNTTLTGRQWGIAPRVGAAWQPAIFKQKVVVRAGGGIYYDRGEIFSYFSPGYAIGTVPGGPFGVNQQLPFVNVSTCPVASQSLYEYYLPTCGGNGGFGPPTGPPTDAEGDLANPYGTSLQYKAPVNPKASDLQNFLPNAYSLSNYNDGAPGVINNGQPISLGVYDRANKLPYTMNYTLDIQWQPRNDLAIELGYVGNLGRHQVIPVPFNQPNIATAGSPTLAGGLCPQTFSYGYTVVGASLDPSAVPCFGYSGYQANDEGGNVDLRVPYIGYAAESISYKAAGVDAYNALQAHVEKRMSHGIQVGASYTYSHATDEQSGLGLFYNGNNALNLRSGYGSSDFDRTHVINFNYVFALPDFASKQSLTGKVIDGWSLVGLTILQSGQPYSVIDFSGAIGSIYYSTFNGITNPIVPLAAGCTAKSAVTKASGAFDTPALNAACFTLPVLPAGGLNGAIPSSDPYETGFTTGQRNIFRQSFQKRADASLVKNLPLTDRYVLKYTLDVYNLTNTSSFDIPFNEVAQNSYYNNFPGAVAPGTNPLPTGCGTADAAPGGGGLYSCPSGLGTVLHTVGSPRQIQMSLHFDF